jgi:hypothetical protein
MTCGLGTTLVRMTPVASTVILATVVRLSYAATGADSGQPVVLLQGPYGLVDVLVAGPRAALSR